jgi:hypothetical protein
VDPVQKIASEDRKAFEKEEQFWLGRPPAISTTALKWAFRLAGSLENRSEKAFHEKAGRSQVGSFVFALDKAFLRPSCRSCHPSIRTLR